MWAINQAVRAWTYQRPKLHGFISKVPSLGIVTLCNQLHNFDDWACVCSLWGTQSDDSNLSSGPGWICSIRARGHLAGGNTFPLNTHDVAYISAKSLGYSIWQIAGGWSNTSVTNIAIGDLLRLGRDASITVTVWAWMVQLHLAMPPRVVWEGNGPLSEPSSCFLVGAKVSMAWNSGMLPPERVSRLTPPKWDKRH